MKILVLKNKKQVSEKVADIVSNAVKKNPSSVLGLATGKTMIPVYKNLMKRDLDFSKIKTFNLDEYSGLKETDKKSFHYFMRKYFFNKININKKNIHFPNSNFKKYENEIKKEKIDLQILGIGRNGHIGFNEPDSSFKSITRKVKLTKNTRFVNKLFGKSSEAAFTMGIKTIRGSKKIVLVAFGSKKAEIIAKTIEGKITEKVPASILRKHKDVTFILDEKVASKLKHKKI
jgi:glucosamine-6-phosphate deaminase